MTPRRRRQRLAVVARLAARAEEAAAIALSEAVQQLQAAEATLSELQRYRAGYQDGGSAHPRWLGAHWTDYREFLDKLDQAIDAQCDVIEHFRAQHRRAQAHWQQQHGRHQSLVRLDESLCASERDADSRQQQKLLDELRPQRPSGFAR